LTKDHRGQIVYCDITKRS